MCAYSRQVKDTHVKKKGIRPAAAETAFTGLGKVIFISSNPDQSMHNSSSKFQVYLTNRSDLNTCRESWECAPQVLLEHGQSRAVPGLLKVLSSFGARSSGEPAEESEVLREAGGSSCCIAIRMLGYLGTWMASLKEVEGKIEPGVCRRADVISEALVEEPPAVTLGRCVCANARLNGPLHLFEAGHPGAQVSNQLPAMEQLLLPRSHGVQSADSPEAVGTLASFSAAPLPPAAPQIPSAPCAPF